MRRTLVILASGAAVAAASDTRIGAQDIPQNEATPAFAVASIRPSRPTFPVARITFGTTDRFSARNVTVRALIQMAYGRAKYHHAEQIVGAPSWMDEDRFDIEARADERLAAMTPRGLPERLAGMLQGLLEERFDLHVHADVRELPVYVLVLARDDRTLGARLRRSDVNCASPAGATDAVCGEGLGNGRLTLGGRPITRLAEQLGPAVGRPVIDGTGLSGDFTLELDWAADPADDGPSVFTAVQEQLGLRLESRRAPVPVLVVDRVNRPTEN